VRNLERIFLFLGGLGLLTVGLVYADAYFASKSAIRLFHLASAQAGQPDQSLWSDSARAKYERLAEVETPLALLQIERLNLNVPVYAGTHNLTLNRGAGIVEGTSLPGEHGNIAVSAHRDSFFRSLKDIDIDDDIVLVTRDGKKRYRVNYVFITDPLDLSVLEDTDVPTLTLITCYPFYFAGHAPDRFIVQAVESTL
jgi:LPXTG-site transpeptidase (sortase) family protein